jgi:hypothetical protein
MAYIGKTPTKAPLTSSDIANDIINSDHIGDTAISGFSALTSAPADTDEFLISDGGVLKRLDASLVGGGNTIAISHVQDTTNYTQSNQGETVFGSGLTFTPASTTSQVVAIIEAHVATGNDGSDNDNRTLFRFYSTNSSGNSIKELDTFAEFGHVNMQSSSHTMYGYFTSVISNCQRDSSNNVVIKITAVSNQDPGTTVYLENHRAVFLEIG